MIWEGAFRITQFLILPLLQAPIPPGLGHFQEQTLSCQVTYRQCVALVEFPLSKPYQKQENVGVNPTLKQIHLPSLLRGGNSSAWGCELQLLGIQGNKQCL